MEEIEVIKILNGCKPLLNRLSIGGYEINLTEEDKNQLVEFNRVWLSGWLDEGRIYMVTGITHKEIRQLLILQDKSLP